MSKKKEERNPNVFEKSIVTDKSNRLHLAWWTSTMAKLDNYLAKESAKIKVSKGENKSKRERREEAAGTV